MLSSIIFPSIAHTHTFSSFPSYPLLLRGGVFFFREHGLRHTQRAPFKNLRTRVKKTLRIKPKTQLVRQHFFESVLSGSYRCVCSSSPGSCLTPAAVSTEGVEEDVRTSTEKGDGVFLSLSFLRLQLTRHHHLPPSSSDRERFALYSVANRKILHI